MLGCVCQVLLSLRFPNCRLAPSPHAPTPRRPYAVYSATSNKFEVKLANIEVEAQTMAETRRTTTRRNCCSRLWGQLSRRTAFLATPPPIWIFLIALGLATAFAVCVGQVSLCAWWWDKGLYVRARGEGLCVRRGGARVSAGMWASLWDRVLGGFYLLHFAWPALCAPPVR
jgi:hypothetical protein